MNKKSRITVLLISIIFSLSAFSITAFAEDYTDAPPAEEPTYAAPEEPTEVYTEAPPETEYIPPETAAPNTDYNYDDYTDYQEPATQYNPGVEGNEGDDGNSGDSSSATDDYSAYDDGSDYTYDEYTPDFEDDDYVIESVQPVSEAELYDVNKVDDSELSKSDWDSIAKSLENASNKGGGADFSSIKNNKSASDNGLWMLITGALMVILAIVGITYVIISSMNSKKAYAGAPSKEAAAKGGSRSSSSKQRAKSDYNDGYGALSKRKRLDDTAEVRLPKKSNGNHYKD